MERTPKLIITLATVILIIGALAAYAYFQSREYLRGPVITVQEPTDGNVSTSSVMTLSGTAQNVSFLTLNGRQIFTDERGRFRELLLLHKGYNIMNVTGRDRFGKTREQKLELVYRPSVNPESFILNP